MNDLFTPPDSRSLPEADVVRANFARDHGLRLAKPTYCFARLRGQRYCPDYRGDIPHFHKPDSGAPCLKMFARDGKVVLATIEVFVGETALFGASGLTARNPLGDYAKPKAIVDELEAEGFEVSVNRFAGKPLEPFQGGDAVIICAWLPGAF